MKKTLMSLSLLSFFFTTVAMEPYGVAMKNMHGRHGQASSHKVAVSQAQVSEPRADYRSCFVARHGGSGRLLTPFMALALCTMVITAEAVIDSDAIHMRLVQQAIERNRQFAIQCAEEEAHRREVEKQNAEMRELRERIAQLEKQLPKK